jgi:hypothetical protein
MRVPAIAGSSHLSQTQPIDRFAESPAQRFDGAACPPSPAPALPMPAKFAVAFITQNSTMSTL